jgi:hypothetical protein
MRYFGQLKTPAQSQQPPNRRKFAQSGHPDRQARRDGFGHGLIFLTIPESTGKTDNGATLFRQ